MSDVRAFIQALQENLIEPLQRLPLAQLKALDTTHNQSVIDFQNAIGQLYAPPGPFTGKASDALADRLADYYAAENALTAYTSDGLSERISKLIQFCQQVISDLEPKLKDLQGTDPMTLAGQVLATTETGATLGGDETPAASIVQLVIAGIVGTVVIGAQAWQEGKLWDAYDTMHHWEMNMSGLAAHPEPALPTSPDLSQGITVDLSGIQRLTPAQQREVADILVQLTADGYAVDLSEIEDLVRAGYNRATIIALLKLGTIDGSKGKYIFSRDGHPYVAHADQHIGLSSASMIAITQLPNRRGGKGRETTFYGEASAQDAITWAIAGDPAAQAFIDAAVPNSDMHITRCATPAEHKDWGFGYQRQAPTRSGSYPPPILHAHLSCVTVWIAIDPSGKPFIVDAYPTW
ncbi:MAG TPA: hypothetical protein VFV38_50825 [Ktedonobacteraceae bacterium]|nr:hypothetical protein [Ktedonobacteraceae bacterium]